MSPEEKKLSKIGWEFEFYTELSNNTLREKLTKLFNKKVVLADTYHSEIKVTENQFKLEPDFSTGMNGKELVTGPLMYEEGREIFEKMMNFIRRYGETSNKTAIHLNLSFDKSLIKSFKHSFNTLKFILEFDEEKIFELFPNRRNSLYSKTIKQLKPIDDNLIYSKNTFNNHIISYPIEKYRGVNFKKILDDYLEVRYLGGDFYEFKIQEIYKVWDYAIDSIYENCKEETREFTDKNIEQIKEIHEVNKEKRKTLASYDALKENYPDIKFLVDMKNNKKFIDNKLYLLKKKINELFYETDLKKGIINYDSERGRFQLKNFEIENSSFVEVDFLNCKLKGCLINQNCHVHSSVIENTDVEDSKLYKVEAKDTRIKNSFVNKTTKCNKCYIDGYYTFFDGELKESIFRKGNIMKNARIDKNSTEIIEYKKL